MLLIQCCQYCLYIAYSFDQDFCYFVHLKYLIECSSQKPSVYHFGAIILDTRSFTAALSGWCQPPIGQQYARG